MKTHFRWWVAVFLLALAVLAGCGRKTTPLVPDSPRPEAVKAVTAVTRGAAVYLSWPMPTRNVEGKSIPPSDTRRFLIDRADIGRDHKKARFKRYAEIDVENLAPGLLQNNMVTWTDDNVRYGQGYEYRIRAVSARGGISPWSEAVRVALRMSLAAPAGLTAKAGDSHIQLKWDPVRTQLDGSPAEGFAGYNVYRGTDKGIYDAAPLNKEPVTVTSYRDASAVNGHTYYYIVRAVSDTEPPVLESPDSAEASATPRDLTPPARPTGLTVVAGITRVFLTWDENREADLAGYHVYRSTRSGKGYERLTEKLLIRTTFSDERVKGGVEYYYVVTAVDRAGNESARSEEKRAVVEKLR